MQTNKFPVLLVDVIICHFSSNLIAKVGVGWHLENVQYRPYLWLAVTSILSTFTGCCRCCIKNALAIYKSMLPQHKTQGSYQYQEAL